MVLTGRYNPLKVEEEISRWWSENRVLEKVFKLNEKAPVFAFLEGPPTVNGYMHVGHARGRVYKDIILRFQTMNGLYVWRRGGWDCLGLPTELETEKRLGLKSKKDVEKIGMERFVEEANKLVDYYIDHWRKASERLAVWLDYDNAYQTRHERYIEHVWWLIKQAYEKGDLVESYRVVPFCPRCETPLSSHEVAQGYEEVEDPSIYVKFRLKGSGNQYVVIWTTTPWTLVANEAVAVHPYEKYVKVRVGDEYWILGEKLAALVLGALDVSSYEIVDRFDGSSIVGLEYEHPLIEKVPAHNEHKPPAHTIIAAEFVTMEEGTGCVHTAPAHGPEDFEAGRKVGLPIFNPVAPNGYFTEAGGEFSGKYFKEVSEEVMDYLQEKGLLLKRDKVRHNYPHCWRCGSPLIYLSSKQWFLSVKRIKKLMIEGNKKILWKPKWAGEHRFGDWLENAEDWCITRTKIWGTPLPIWRCERCGEIRIVSSKKELEEAEVKPPEIRLLRPWVDRVMFRCRKCGAWMKREPFVMDTWLDSGMAHTASIDGLHNQDLFKKLFPYDFITEAIDQTRGWFYTLLFTSTLLYGEPPYRSVLNQGHVMDAQGRKMSKSRGNVIWAMDMMEKYGADPLRLYLASKAAPWENMNFVEREVEQIIQELNILWNVFSFTLTYFELDKFDPERISVESIQKYLKPEDKWILSKINSLTSHVTSNLKAYNIHSAVRAIRDFIVEDLSRLYVRAIRRRVWIEEETWDKKAVYATLYYVLRKLTLLIAPITPYLAEKLYQEIKLRDDPESVHMCSWPRPDEEFVDEELEDDMEIARTTISEAIALRQKHGRKLRWPIKTLILAPHSPKIQKSLKKLDEFIKSQVNALDLRILNVGEKPEGVRIRVKPLYEKLGPKLKKDLGEVVERLSRMDGEYVKSELESQGALKLVLSNGRSVELSEEDLSFEEELPENLGKISGRFADIYIDLSETREIVARSLAREVIRRIQVMRKEMNLNISDYINAVVVLRDEEDLQLLNEMKDYIMEEIRGKSLTITLDEKKSLEGGYEKTWNIEGKDYRMIIARAGD
ncbi:MAG: isoleucine--tRNA ligase [Thaumarchaeota archaeon]|nr:isoleucine--tRNA ligase [Nitrososphaerota archaeon]